MLPSKSLFIFAALVSSLSFACSGSEGDASPDESAEGELGRAGAKVLFRGVTAPSGLAVTEGHVYFGSNKFIASGDNELDQQFAHWAGKFSRVPRAGGRAETVADIGPVNRVRAAGSKLFYSMSSGCWISSYDTAGRGSNRDDSVYHESDCEPDWGSVLAGFEIVDNRLVVVHSTGKVTSMKLDGSDSKAVADLDIADNGVTVDSIALGDGKIFILTPTALSNGRGGRDIKQAIYSVTLANGKLTKVVELDKQPSNFTSDGKNLFWSQEKNKVMTLKAGSSEPKLVSEDFREVIDLAAPAEGGRLFVADSERNAVYQIDSAASAPGQPKKLGDVKGVRTLSVSGNTVFFGSHVISGRRAAGVIGSLPISD